MDCHIPPSEVASEPEQFEVTGLMEFDQAPPTNEHHATLPIQFSTNGAHTPAPFTATQATAPEQFIYPDNHMFFADSLPTHLFTQRQQMAARPEDIPVHGLNISADLSMLMEVPLMPFAPPQELMPLTNNSLQQLNEAHHAATRIAAEQWEKELKRSQDAAEERARIHEAHVFELARDQVRHHEQQANDSAKACAAWALQQQEHVLQARAMHYEATVQHQASETEAAHMSRAQALAEHTIEQKLEHAAFAAQHTLQQQQALERERSRIAQDLHDDLGAGLVEINFGSELAQDPALGMNEVREHTREIGTRAREMVTALDEIVWAVNPKHDSVSSLATYFCQFAQHF